MEKEKIIKKIKQIKAIALRDSKDKTVLVEVKFLKIHPLYKKRYFSNRKMLVHTESEVKAGQTVLISETRPISRKKAWKVVEVK
ncbi:MAG: 30S ribosomal protein S17 [Berkelbacteria bacterium GW2011_GWA1_36_9]|uniref:30S ribosomal protein S17 n=1 Tax=Berkelbacteria bacterium GW2011_GWA1_36_9 TaxID=1618331 RepID=A0A0G0FGK3_9BACT|nr:MAG: 30S ribosomal protein S17 [Berkelbacteria bacterium GW2011_GWA1_36_9]